MTTITVPTIDLLAAIRDTAAFTARSDTTAVGCLMLHTSPDWLGVTATTDRDATVCATGTVEGAGDGWGEKRFVLTRDGVKHLAAFAGQARRAEGQDAHEVQLTLTPLGALHVTEAGGLFPSTADVEIKATMDPDEWPAWTVQQAIMQQLDAAQPACRDALPSEWLQRCATVAARRGVPLRQHSPGRGRCLVSVGATWTASLPTVEGFPHRCTVADLYQTSIGVAA